MAVRPFRLCTAADQAAFTARATLAFSAWADEWLGTAAEAALSCAPLMAVAPEDDAAWLRVQGAAGTVWIAADQVRAVTAWLFGTPQASGGGLAATAAQAGLNALALRLAQAPAGEAALRAPAPLHLLEPGRAVLRACIEFAEAELVLLAELPAPERAMAPLNEPLGGLGSALGTQEVRLQAWLGEAELELRALRTLAVGDVLRLNRKLDEPVELEVNHQRVPCRGYLGARDGSLAVEIVRL